MSLAAYVRALGRGPGRSRSLERPEARDALSQILAGTAEPEATGALLMLMRYRGEKAEEIAGFVDALRDAAGPFTGTSPALDWPSYAAGRTRGLPWFLLAAKLVARSGQSVLLHGWNSHQADHARVRDVLGSLGIAIAGSLEGAADLIQRQGIAYLPLEAVSPAALDVLRLRDVLGLRSPINTALRLFNPSRARTSVQGVFHPPYRALQRDAAALLGQPRQMVLKGAGGEFERTPAKPVQLMGLRSGSAFEITAPALMEEAPGRHAEGPDLKDPGALAGLWEGRQSDPYAEAIVLGTAAAAFHALGNASDLDTCLDLARRLWSVRQSRQAA